MTQPTPPSAAPKKHVDSPQDGDHAVVEAVTTGGYSEESYRKLKRKLKEMMTQNESIAYSLEMAKKKIRRLRREKSILLDTVARSAEFANSSPDASDTSSDEMMSDIETELPQVPINKPQIDSTNPSAPARRQASPSGSMLLIRPAKPAKPTPSAKPRRVRKGPVAVKVRRIQPLERDPVTNDYKLPARIGILTVHTLGHIVWQYDTYHNDRYIWPVGFCVSRTYLSMTNPDINTNYVCSILDGGETGPKYHVVADDAPNEPIIANSATGAWTVIVRRANEIRNRGHSNSASGPDYYGLTHPTIAKMIQDLPNADKCRNYVWQEFEVMQERTAAGVAAAAQKKLENLVKMGSANKKPPGSAPGRSRKSKIQKAYFENASSQAQSPDESIHSAESSPQQQQRHDLSNAPVSPEAVVSDPKQEMPDISPSDTNGPVSHEQSHGDYAAMKVAALQVPDNQAAIN
ncbi:hypothetical protein VKS41_003491 [Umbelopsis sp. WA50703]